MSDRPASEVRFREAPVQQCAPPESRRLRRAVAWLTGLSLVGGLALGLLAAVEHVQESAARAH